MGEIIIFSSINAVFIVAGTIALVTLVRLRRKQHVFHLRLITILTSTIALRDLLERVATEIKTAEKARHVSLFVFKPDGHFVSAGTKGYIRPTRSDCQMLESYFTRTGKVSVRTSTLEHESEVRRLLNSYQIVFTLPLKRGDVIIGYLFFGPKSHGSYSPYDISMVSDIVNELSIAVQNAASSEAVKELNATLQQRVDLATSELRKSNEQLRGLDVAKDEFLSMASHQLRTPLTSVKGYISMVLEGDGGKVTKLQTQLLSEAFTSSERMVHLINDFLNVSRVQTGKFTIEKREVDLAKIVRQEVHALETSANARNLALKMHIPANPVPVMVDEGKIRQVIMNFIDNALYYSRPETSVSITLSVLPKELKLEVQDKGIGVPIAEQKHLFTKFFRAQNAKTHRPDGTGVGLYLAKMVIDGHGGKVLFSSVEGSGSIFGFSIPRGNLEKSGDTNTDKR